MSAPGASSLSRQSSTSSISVPFATPPSSPQQLYSAAVSPAAAPPPASRIPRISPTPPAAAAAGGKARSYSASAGTTASSGTPVVRAGLPSARFGADGSSEQFALDDDAGAEVIVSPPLAVPSAAMARYLSSPSSPSSPSSSSGVQALTRARSADDGSARPLVVSSARPYTSTSGASGIPRRHPPATHLRSPLPRSPADAAMRAAGVGGPRADTPRVSTVAPKSTSKPHTPKPSAHASTSRTPSSRPGSSARRRAESNSPARRRPHDAVAALLKSPHADIDRDQRAARANGASGRDRLARSPSAASGSAVSATNGAPNGSAVSATNGSAPSLSDSADTLAAARLPHHAPGASRLPQPTAGRVNRRWSLQPTSPPASSPSSSTPTPSADVRDTGRRSVASSRSGSPAKQRSSALSPTPSTPPLLKDRSSPSVGSNSLSLHSTPSSTTSTARADHPSSAPPKRALQPPTGIPQLSSPRLDRKSPGLTIDPPPPPLRNTLVSGDNASRGSSLRPVPPAVPRKSPLRQLGAGDAAPSKPSARHTLSAPVQLPAAAPPPSVPVPPVPVAGQDAPPPSAPAGPSPDATGPARQPAARAAAPDGAPDGGRQTPTPPDAPSPPLAMLSPPPPPAPHYARPPALNMSGGYTPAMLTSRSAPPDTLDAPDAAAAADAAFPYAYQDAAPPPSAPPDSLNNWVVGALGTTDSPQDMYADSFLSRAHPSQTDAAAAAETPADEFNVPRWHDKALPAVPNASPRRSPRTPTSTAPVRAAMRSSLHAAQPSPVPSGGRPRGATESSQHAPRSHTSMTSAGLAPSQQSRPQSMVAPSIASTPSPTHSTPLSRRAHLIREIANTERAHATDLALICDAYISGRESLLIGRASRPDSQHSTNTQHSSADHSNASTPALVDPPRPGHFYRNSSYGMASVEELRRPNIVPHPEHRMSGHEASTWSAAWNGIKSPSRKGSHIQATPSHSNGSLIDSLVTTSPATLSTTSVGSTIFPSPRFPTPLSFTSTSFSRGARPLATADVKTIFLNLSLLAALADELATGFETALGALEDEIMARGEGGGDRLGEVFTQMLPRLRPLYMYYCSRHSAASARLVELQGDPSYTAYLNDCWAKVKSHTHAWNLDSMLIKPVQRITKYPLLFEDLLACTTPVHPDYFNIRNAAEGARALALEIDDAKRRKDVITSVIGKTPLTVSLVKDVKGTGAGRGLMALRRFKKDKSGSHSAAVSPSDPTGAPHDIAPYMQAQLRDLVAQLETSQKHVHHLGKEMVDWVSATKIVLKNEIVLNLHFLTMYTLDGAASNHQGVIRVRAYKALLEDLLANAWEELNNQVCNSILLMFGKLLDAAKNPTMIIDNLNKKAADYARYLAHRNTKKPVPDRALLHEATEYVAIHTQLLEELPVFLEGYTRILDIAVAAFTMAQGRYFAEAGERIGEFNSRFLSVPTEQVADGVGIRDVLVDLSTARGIHKAWLNAFREPNLGMRSLDITSGDGLSRLGSSRTATAHSHSTHRPPPMMNGGSSRPASRAASRAGTHLMSPPPLSHHTTSPEDTLIRRRSSSFTAIQDAARSAVAESRAGIAGLVRRNSKNSSSTNLSSLTGSLNRSMTNLAASLPLQRSKSRTRSTASTVSTSTEDKDRHSFGLPRLSMQDGPLFDSTFTKVPVYYAQPSPSATDLRFSALGFADMPLTADPPAQPILLEAQGPRMDSIAESWRNSPILYTCAAVADFDPVELGNHKFQGLYFLPLLAGDLVDVYHEIGRVADLYDFPYSQVGVENDGAVVCRAESGAIGVAMCSFLEPLRT